MAGPQKHHHLYFASTDGTDANGLATLPSDTGEQATGNWGREKANGASEDLIKEKVSRLRHEVTPLSPLPYLLLHTLMRFRAYRCNFWSSQNR